jgi:hypothetical protein
LASRHGRKNDAELVPLEVNKPYAESSEINKVPILAVLKEIFAERKRVLEIASGTGQHAVYFGRELPHLIWQPSELAQNLAGHTGLAGRSATAQRASAAERHRDGLQQPHPDVEREGSK